MHGQHSNDARGNRLTDIEGRGGEEIRTRIEDVRSQLGQMSGVEAVLIDFVEDDLRETAASIGSLEEFLRGLLRAFNRDGIQAEELLARATDDEVLDRIDYLREVMENLQKRVTLLADKID